MQLDRGTAI